jgi:hypothetical protein
MNTALALPSWLRRVAPFRVLSSRREPVELDLLAGQRADVTLSDGESLRVSAGHVRLALPARWIGETLVTPTLALRAGEVHRAVGRETVGVCASETSRVQRLV